jgi:hypothetical protein
MTLMTGLPATHVAAAEHLAHHAIGRAWSTGVAMSGIASRHALGGSFVACSGTVTEDGKVTYMATNGRKTTPTNGTRRPWDPLL